MKRIIPTAIGGFGLLMLMYRSFEVEREAARAAANNSSRFQAVDGVLHALGETGGIALPPGLLIAGIAMVLAVGYAVVS
jgi:hypothetical protein